MNGNSASIKSDDGVGSGQVHIKKRIWPYLLIVAGLMIVVVGFFYDVAFAGIPYQDPTPAMEKSYAFHSRIASAIRWCGVAAFLLGVVRAFRRVSRKQATGCAGFIA